MKSSIGWVVVLVACCCFGLNEARKVCIPNKTYMERCNVCVCGKDGLNMYCKKRPCPPNEYLNSNAVDDYDLDDFLPKQRVPYLDDEMFPDKEESFSNEYGDRDASAESSDEKPRFDNSMEEIQLDDDAEEIGSLSPAYRFRREILI